MSAPFRTVDGAETFGPEDESRSGTDSGGDFNGLCETCGKRVISKRPDAKFCSQACRSKATRSRNGYTGQNQGDSTNGTVDGPAPEKPRFTVVMARDCRTILTGREAIKGVLPAKGMAVIYGEPGCGKTFTAIAMFMASARGIDWHGRKTRPLKVLYIAPDGGAFVQNRIVAYMRHHGIEGDDVAFAIISQPVDVLGVTSPEHLDELRAVITDFAASEGGFDPDIIVIDTVSRSMPGGNENAPEHMTKWVDRAHRIAPGKLVVGVHHSGKDVTRGSRGHSSLKGATDCEIEVADGTITVRKLRDGQGGARFGFELTVVELGVDEDGDVVTSCVAEETTPPADGSGLSPEAQIILRSLEKAYGNSGNATSTLSRKEINDVIDEHIGDALIEKAGDDPKAIERASKANRKRRERHFAELKRAGYIAAAAGSPLCTVRFPPDEGLE